METDTSEDVVTSPISRGEKKKNAVCRLSLLKFQAKKKEINKSLIGLVHANPCLYNPLLRNQMKMAETWLRIAKKLKLSG